MTTSTISLPIATEAEDALWRLRAELDGLFAIAQVTYPIQRDEPIRYVGRLLRPADEAFPQLQQRLARQGYTPMLHQEGTDDVLLVVPGLFRATRSRAWINAVLFVLTVFTTLLAGAANELGTIPTSLPQLLTGVPFAFSLLAILGAHELGHYFLARHHKVDVTLPYFIPVPIGVGTFGAFIKMKSPVTDRRALFDVAVAGPLAGLAVAIPLLLIGLNLSDVAVMRGGGGGIQEGNSLLYAAMKFLVFGQWLPGNGQDVYLHPMAFAAWFGLLITAFNLLPVGQLDGGHIIYALLGKSSRWIGYVVLAVLVVLGFVAWNGWFMWAFLIVFVTGMAHPSPLNEVTVLDGRRKILGWLAMLVFFLTFTPTPLAIMMG